MNWNNLTKDERAEFMRLQMSPQGGYDCSGYLPDDCGECGACGQPLVGGGWCRSCSLRWGELYDKLIGKGKGEAALFAGQVSGREAELKEK